MNKKSTNVLQRQLTALQEEKYTLLLPRFLFLFVIKKNSPVLRKREQLVYWKGLK